MERESRGRGRDGSSGADDGHGLSSPVPRLVAALVIGCGIAVAVAVMIPREEDPRHGHEESAMAGASGDRPPDAPELRPDALEHEQATRRRVPDFAPPPEDPLSDEWDHLAPAERIRIQRDRFAKAIAGARAGEDVEQNLARARNALTVLRPEMHATVGGRAEHGRLEARLDALAEGGEASPSGGVR